MIASARSTSPSAGFTAADNFFPDFWPGEGRRPTRREMALSAAKPLSQFVGYRCRAGIPLHKQGGRRGVSDSEWLRCRDRSSEPCFPRSRSCAAAAVSRSLGDSEASNDRDLCMYVSVMVQVNDINTNNHVCATTNNVLHFSQRRARRRWLVQARAWKVVEPTTTAVF